MQHLRGGGPIFQHLREVGHVETGNKKHTSYWEEINKSIYIFWKLSSRSVQIWSHNWFFVIFEENIKKTKLIKSSRDTSKSFLIVKKYISGSNASHVISHILLEYTGNIIWRKSRVVRKILHKNKSKSTSKYLVSWDSLWEILYHLLGK